MHTAWITAAVRAQRQGSAPAQAIPAAKAAQVWPDGKEFGSAEVSRGIRPSTIT